MSFTQLGLALFFSSLLFSASASAFEDTWHAAFGAGMAKLKPDTRDSNYSLTDDQANAIGVNFGLDINPIITAELGFTNLGSATAERGLASEDAATSASQAIGYQAVSLGAVAYLWGEKEAHFRQEGLSAYLRLGLSSIEYDSDVAIRESNSTSVWLGAGLQWPFNDQLSLRGEATSFDGDVQAVMASVVWRNARAKSNTLLNDPMSDARSPQPVAQPVTQPAPEAPTPVVESAPPSNTQLVAETTRTPLPKPVQRTAPRTVAATATSSVDNNPDNCYSSTMRAKINQRACSVLDGVLAGLDFKRNTSEITLLGRASLDRVANALRQYPRAVVELRVHTQTFPEEGFATKLSRERARNVAKYLLSRGTPIRQMRARAFGSAFERADNASSVGRRANNRVEIKLL